MNSLCRISVLHFFSILIATYDNGKEKKPTRSIVTQDVSKTSIEMPVVNPKAARIEVGRQSFFVWVGQGPIDVRGFGVFICNLHCAFAQLRTLCLIRLEHIVWKMARACAKSKV
jgi:hypothetical protein